jgi:hypothetical protein
MKTLENSEAPFPFVFAIVCWTLMSDNASEAAQGTYLVATIHKI